MILHNLLAATLRVSSMQKVSTQKFCISELGAWPDESWQPVGNALGLFQSQSALRQLHSVYGRNLWKTSMQRTELRFQHTWRF
jgi:hypothetical protein